MIYDFERKQYVGVFSNIYLRFWDSETEDINKVKRLKMHKPIHDVIQGRVNHKKVSIVVYKDGSCESLESALESRGEGKSHHEPAKTSFTVDQAQFTNGVFSYIKIVGQEKHFYYTAVEPDTIKSFKTQKSFKLKRPGEDAMLMGLTITRGKTDTSEPSLITIWSDKRLFKQTLSSSDNYLPSFGALHSIIDSISALSPLAVVPISEDCIAIYAGKSSEDGSFVILYNVKYKIVQSKVPFKVYLNNFKLWSINKNIFLAMGEQLSVIPYRITIDHLSSMVGSQCVVNDVQPTTVEKEMINEDVHYEQELEFDEDQTPVEGMDFQVSHENFPRQAATLTNAKPVVGAEEVANQLNELYREELVVDLIRPATGATVEAKLLSNIDETSPLLEENFELFCNELEKHGCSEIEITNRVIPALIRTNRTKDIGLMLKRYNHVSEHTLTKVIKYLLSCNADEENDQLVKQTNGEGKEFNVGKVAVRKEKKIAASNIFLNSTQSERRDVLSIVLCSSFDSQTILKFLRKEINLNDMVKLMDHLYKILTVSVLDDPFDMRGNLVEGDDFDLDTKLFEWLKLLIDSHYQQILLSHDEDLHKKLGSWLELVDTHIRILSEMNDIRPLLVKLATNKPIQLSKKCDQWYSIEKLQLYD